MTSDKLFCAIYEMQDRSLVLVLYTPPPGIPHPRPKNAKVITGTNEHQF